MLHHGRRRGRPRATKADPAASNIKSLNRALDVLEALAAHEGVTLSGLSSHLHESTATMHRVLSTLERREYVECDPERQEWFIGPAAFKLGSAFLGRTNLVERSRLVMRDLVTISGETSNLGIHRDGQVLFVSQVETQETIRAFLPPGTSAPLHASGIGKALLSSFDDDRLEAFISTAKFTRFTDRTISSANQLRKAIKLTRQCGYALDDEERTIGMRCVAATILDVHGEAVAGISISGPTIRMPDKKVRQIGKWVMEAANEISRRVGAG
ncbi:Transcriptional regulator, IclR family [Hyphomicrobium sulfonivorans]|uniref:Transcriptional regulator, IclR family n=1 Tax=Hyphomicrobium sulfonivorans TaxID=121290 RepID=A0A109BJT8_HYPSL|nr:HTH-type transcriptional regulator BhcR [Hyphomicrobium sulfonivorans]KWT69302.1 Transcriptional regulator, IclR family [Hyphomicrobium sulfonivorans]